MIVIQKLCKRFDEKPVLTDLSLEIPDGAVCGVYGKSGIGKSTLAKILCGVSEPDSGSIFLDDVPLYDEKKRYNRKAGLQIQMVYQQPYATLDPRQRIGDGFRELISYHRFAPKGQERSVTEDALRKVNLKPDILSHLPHQISGGEAQRVAIARSLLFHPRLLILDEASSMLDVSTQANVLGMVRRQMAAAGGSILLISHDEGLVDFYCDQIYRFDR